MNRALLVFAMFAACAEPSEIEQLPEQPPAPPVSEPETEPEPEPETGTEPAPEGNPIDPCTLEPLTSSARVQQTGVNEDGMFWIRLGSQGESCDGSGSWGGWKVSIVFQDGRPVPGVYDLDNDPGLDVRSSYSEGKTDGLQDQKLPGGTLHVSDVDGDGTVEGTLCGLRFMTEFALVEVDGGFVAGPC